MENNRDQLKNQLRQARLRATPSRLAVLALLRESAKPMDVLAILRSLGETAPNQATVYRILSHLVAAGLVRAVTIKAGTVSYEISDLPHHHHLICEKCGFVADVTACCDDPKPIVSSFHTVTHHQLEYSGVCNNCAA